MRQKMPGCVVTLLHILFIDKSEEGPPRPILSCALTTGWRSTQATKKASRVVRYCKFEAQNLSGVVQAVLTCHLQTNLSESRVVVEPESNARGQSGQNTASPDSANSAEDSAEETPTTQLTNRIGMSCAPRLWYGGYGTHGPRWRKLLLLFPRRPGTFVCFKRTSSKGLSSRGSSLPLVNFQHVRRNIQETGC